MIRHLISIVTITKDDVQGRTATIASAHRLRELGAEHIVVDGSSENDRLSPTPEEVNLTVLPRPPCGRADAFNAGLDIANGEWIWFLNGGDTVHEQLDPSWLFALLKKTQADVVTGAIHYAGEEHPRPAPPLWGQWPLLVCWIPHPATLVRRSALMRLSGFNPKFKICMDFDLWHRLLSKNTAVDIVALPFARFDINGVSQCRENRRFLAGENAKILWKHKGEIVKSLCRIMVGIISVTKHIIADRWF
jgi:hypothetical protein